MPRLIPLPDEFADEPFRVARARAKGLGEGRLRGPDLVAPFRGVRAPAPLAHTVSALCRAYNPRMPPTHMFSHVTAAVLHGIPLPLRARSERRLHVTVPAGNRAPQITGVVGHELRRELMDGELLRGLPVSTPLQTWIDLATSLSVWELVAVGDFLCGGEHPRYTPNELRTVAGNLRGRRGCRALRAAAALVRERVGSPKETEARLLLGDADYPEPVVSFGVPVSAHLTLHPDLAWPRYRVGLDYEGEEHRTDKRRFRRDITRRELFEEVHWRVVRVTEDDLKDSGRMLLARVRAALTARGWRG